MADPRPRDSADRTPDDAGAVAAPADTGSREEMKKVMGESDLIATLGGVRGVIESSIAGVVFALAYSVSGQNLTVSLWAAIVSGLLVVVVSVVQRRSVQQAVAGFVGIAIMAAISRFTGKPQDFYLWPILKNAAFAAAYLLSMLVRWPLIGVVLGPLLGEGMAWRKDPARLRAYTLASGVWAAMFGIRFAVQLPLYLAGNVTWLGIQAIPLGLPLFLLVCWTTFVVLARVPLARKPDSDSDSGSESGSDSESDSGSDPGSDSSADAAVDSHAAPAQERSVSE